MTFAWENSLHFVTPPLRSPQSDVCETSTEIPHWWRVTIEIWVVLLIGGSKFPANQKHYPDPDDDASSVWNFCTCFSDVISRENLWPVSRNISRSPRLNLYQYQFHCGDCFFSSELNINKRSIYGNQVVMLLACVAGVKRGRGNLGAWGRKERKACKDAIVFSVFHAQIVKIVIGQN